ncbi:hypothetical protein BHM03_00037749 [Ensete ventricosum]|nr:hypothetical protein BHM03_00037749 [Ensete ventricosum]
MASWVPWSSSPSPPLRSGSAARHWRLPLRRASLPSVDKRAPLTSSDGSYGRRACRCLPCRQGLPIPTRGASVGADPLRAGRGWLPL